MTQEEFLKLYNDLQTWKSVNLQKPLPFWDEVVRTVHFKIFGITPQEMLNLFPDRLEAMKYYKNIHGFSLPETVKLFPVTLVEISFEVGYYPPLDGISEIWVWSNGNGLNRQYISTKPIWEFLTSKQVFDLYCGENIQITQETLDKNFKLVC
jgi:hypothetical protein